MTRYGEPEQPIWKLVDTLRAELAWYPGRVAVTGRIVLACTTVMVLAEIFRIPGAALGASFPLLVSRDNAAAARKSALQIAVGCSIGTLAVVIGGMSTAGSPFFHVLWITGSLFSAFFAISALNFMSAALASTVVVAVAVQAWDYPVSAETRVEHTLYTLLAILIACAVSMFIETVFEKEQSHNLLLDGISTRLGMVEAFLRRTANGESELSALAIQLSRSAAKGVDDLSAQLAHGDFEPGFHDSISTVIALTRQLTELGSNLAESSPPLSSEERARCAVVANNLSTVRFCLTCKQLPEWIDLPLTANAPHPILVEIERTVELIAQSYSEGLRIRHLSADSSSSSRRERRYDALRDPMHFKFAVRGTTSSMICYLFYMGVGWMGLGGSIITCALTARRFTGASRHRQGLRFAGFILGAGVFGLGTEVLIMPQIDSLIEFALIFASVTAIGSWIATSGPRLAFSGFQIVLAYSLVSLTRFTINTSLVPARDQLLGVVLGVVAMWLVFDHLWAETSALSVRKLFLKTLRNLADYNPVASNTPQKQKNQVLAAASSMINRDIDQLRDLADMYAFESFPKESHESLVNRSIRTLLPELRAFLLIRTGVLQHRSLTERGEVEELINDVEECASRVLHGLANAIELEAPGELALLGNAAEELLRRVQIEVSDSKASNNVERHTETQLCASMVKLASDLEFRARKNFSVEFGHERGLESIASAAD